LIFSVKQIYGGVFKDTPWARKDLFNILERKVKDAGGFVNMQQVSFQVTTDEKHRTVVEASVDIPTLDEQQALLFVEEILNGKDDSY